MNYTPEEIRAAIMAAHQAGDHQQALKLAQMLLDREQSPEPTEITPPAVEIEEPAPERNPALDRITSIAADAHGRETPEGIQRNRGAEFEARRGTGQRWGKRNMWEQDPPRLVDVPEDQKTFPEPRIREDGLPFAEGLAKDAVRFGLSLSSNVKRIFAEGRENEFPPLVNSDLLEQAELAREEAKYGKTPEVTAEDEKGAKSFAMGRGLPGRGVPEGTVGVGEEEDSLGKVLWDSTVKSAKPLAGMFVTGYQAMYNANKRENVFDWIDQLKAQAEVEGVDLVNSMAVEAAALGAGLTPEDIVEDLAKTAIERLEGEEEKIEQMNYWMAELQKVTPKTREGSLKYYAGAITQAGMVMGPAYLGAMLVGVAGGGPVGGTAAVLGIMGTQVYFQAYGQARAEGRTHGQATIDATVFAAAELLGESTPTSIILGKGGKTLLKKILTAGASGAAEEIVTETLTQLYEAGVLDDDMTFGEAINRIRHSAVIGAGMGVQMSVLMHPFVRNSEKKNLPPEMRDLLGAVSDHFNLMERAADPTQKVTREEIDASRKKFAEAQKIAKYAKDNPAFAETLGETYIELDKAEQEVAREKKLKGLRNGSHLKAAEQTVERLKGAVQKLKNEALGIKPEEGAQEAAAPKAEEAAPAAKPAEAQAAVTPEVADETGKINYSLQQLATAGANAVLPDGYAKKLIDQGLAKETAAGGLMILPEGRRALAEWKEKRHENVINVGLDIGNKKDALSTDRVKEELAKIGVEVIAEERRASSTENTMIATLSRRLGPTELHDLSVALDQEAIGGRWGDTGVLEGPQAASWGGAFDPAEFREPTTPRPQAAKKTEIADPDGSIARKKAEEKAASTKVNVDEALAKAIVEAKAKKPNPILEPEKVTVLNKDPVATAEDVATLQAEFEKSPEAFDLRTAELKAEIAVAETQNPAARQAIEVALDVRERVKAEQEAVGRAEQENAAYARQEARKAKAEAKKNREIEEMIRQEGDAKADEAIALAEFLNKQQTEESSPGALASALKDAYASLESRELAAMDRLKAKLGRPVQGTLFDLGGAIAEGSKLYADLVEVGALKIAKGLVRFADWSTEMVNDFGKRITPHLQKLYTASRAAAEDAVAISHRKFKSGPQKGKIVAAPPGAQTMKQLARLRNETLKKLAKEGEPGRFWYERSGKAVLDSFGGDVATSRLFVGLLALYSAGSTVGANTTAALKVWNQWRAGEDIRGATGVQNRKALEWLETGIEPPGLKISNFYNNLMREIDPANYDVGQGATIDLWMMRAFGFLRDAPTDAQYVFSQTEIKKLAKALGWEPQQAQAAIWVAIKARWEMIREAGRREAIKKGYAELVPEGKNGNMILKAKGDTKQAAANQRKINALFRKLALRVADSEVKLAVQSTKADYLDELSKHAAIVSWGSTPSSSVGQTLLGATFAEKLEFQAEIERIMINPETGREWLAEWLGVIGNDSFSGIGAWDMNIGATQQNVLLAPPAPPESGQKPDVDPGAKRMLSAYSSMIGWLLKLDAVSWHRPLFTATKRDSNGIDVDMGRQLDAKEVELVYGAIAQHLKDAFGISHEQALEYAPVPTPYGFRVMNYNDAQRVGRKLVPNYNRKKGETDFHDVVNDALNEVFPLDNMKVEYFGAMGELARNDWATNTDGESYASRISQAKNKQVWETFERAKRELAPRIEEARDQLEKRILARERTGARELDAPVSVDRILVGGADAVAETYGRFGQLTGKDTNAEQKIYDLTRLIENPDLVQAVADAYGYKIEYFSFESNPEAGVEFRLPQLKKKGYKDGYVWIYDPRNSHGSFKGAVEYTRAWRVSHEIAHGITERFMQAKYGDSKRYGRLGRELEVDRGAEGKQVKVTERALTLKEAQRAVEWEDVTFRAQRIILEQMGVKVTDTQFAHENNINLGDAFYRVLTGDFGNPGDFGFLPADKPADIGKVLVALESAEQALAQAQGRAPTPGVNERMPSVYDLGESVPFDGRWTRTTDAEIADAVARARHDGMGQSPAGITGVLDAPRVTLAQSGMAIPRKPANTIRFRDFRPSESRAGGVRKLKVKPETAKVRGEIAMADEFIVDIPLAQIYNATKDVKALRGNKTQAQFEADMVAAGYVGFYQTGKDGKPKGSVTLFESGLVNGMQDSINRLALDQAAPPKTKAPKLRTDNPGGEWLAGKIKQAAEHGADNRGMPNRFGSLTARLEGTVLMPIDQAAAIPGMMNEQSKVREDSLAWLKNHMDATGRLPMMQDGKAEYAPFIQVDLNGNAWVNEGNHRIMAAKALGWTHIPVSVSWFNGGEAVAGKFAPDALIKGHEAMAQKPRLPESKTKVNKLLKRWATVTKSQPTADRGAGLVMVPGAEGTVHLATVRPATAISVESLTKAMREADRANVTLTLAPVSLGKRTAGEVVRSREGTILQDAGFTLDRDTNQLVRPAGQGAMFSISRGTNHGKGITLQEASSIAETMRHQFPRAWMGADIIAVESWEKLPAEIRRGTPDGFSKAGQVEAVFYDPGPLERPQIIIIANNSGSRGEAITAAMHEIVGHYGVRGVLGAGYQNYMDSVWKGFEKEAREAAARNGIKDIDHKDDIKRQDARNKAAEEFIAYLAGEIVSGNKVMPAKIGFWEGLVRAFRQALARFGLVDVNARDIAHLIQSAERYARGGVFAVRESRRRDIMMAQSVPEFYSQMMKYIEDKLPNAATPEQYLEQLEAAQRKGEFKKEEFETASIGVILSQESKLSDFPIETWHKDDLKRASALMEKQHKDGLISKKHLDEFSVTGEMGTLGAEIGAPTKFTKAQLLRLIGKHAVKAKWEMQGNPKKARILNQEVHINGDPIVRIPGRGGDRGVALRSEISGSGLSGLPVNVDMLLERHVALDKLPPVSPRATLAKMAGKLFAEAVAKHHTASVRSNMEDGPGSPKDLESMARDMRTLMNEGSASFYPTAKQAGVDKAYAEIFDALRDLFIESDATAIRRKKAERSAEINKYFEKIREDFVVPNNNEPRSAKMRAEINILERVVEAVFAGFWEHHSNVDSLIPDALQILVEREHPAVAGIDTLNTHAQIGETPLELVAGKVRTSEPVWGWHGDLQYSATDIKVVNRETGEWSDRMQVAEISVAVDAIADMYDWGSGIDPTSATPVSQRWYDYTLKPGVNAYQEWLLLDTNPAGRQYALGHWGKKNAAHLRSGFVIDEGTGRLVPIATEIQSDTGQAWQDRGSKQVTNDTLLDMLSDSSRTMEKAKEPSYNEDGVVEGDGKASPLVTSKPDYSKPGQGVVGRALLELFGTHLPSMMENRALTNISELLAEMVKDHIPSSGNPAGSISHRVKTAFGGPITKEIGQFAASMSALHHVYYKRVREQVEAAKNTIGNLEHGDATGVLIDVIAGSQKKGIDKQVAEIDRIFQKYSGTFGPTAHDATKFTHGLIVSLSRDNGIEAMNEAIVDISTLIGAALDLTNMINLATVTKLNKQNNGMARARRDTADALDGVVAFADTVRDALDGIAKIGSEVWHNSMRDKGREVVDIPWNQQLHNAKLRIYESTQKISEAKDYISGKKSMVSQAPSYASTASHQLAAIKKLVQQAVEHNMPYVFFAPAELSMKVAASTGSIVESGFTHVKKVRFPYEDWAEMMHAYYTHKTAPPGLDGMSKENAEIIRSVMRSMDKMFTSEGYQMDVGRIMAKESKEGAIAAFREATGQGQLFEGMGADKDGKAEIGKKLIGFGRGDYALVYHSPRSYLRDGANLASQSAALTEKDIVDLLGDAEHIIGIFPMKEDGSFASQDEIVGQLGYEGLGLLRGTEIGDTLTQLPAGVEMRVNWGNSNTGFFQNFAEALTERQAQFSTARGLRYAYNNMLPNHLKAFAKKYGAKVSLREASPVADGTIFEDGQADINSFDENAVQRALSDWRDQGMMVQPDSDGPSTFKLPKLLALEVTEKMRNEVRTTGFQMFSIKDGKTGNTLFDSFAAKVGPFGPVRTLRDVWRSFTNRWKDRAIAATLDIFHGQKVAEEALGLNVDQQGYVSMRLAAGSDAVVRAALEYGVPIWKEGATSVDESAGGFLDILKPLASNPDKMRAWELWMVSRRAERLTGEGREKLFEMAEIREVQAEVNRRGWTQEFEAIAANYADWKKRLMDFAEEAGVINPITRPLWEHADHIPFYRVLEGDITGPFSGGAIADVKQQIQRLRGSDKVINDPLQNIFMNMASLIDASMRNHAARLSITNLDGSGLLTKHPQFQITKASVPLDQLRARLRAVGVDTAMLDAAGMRGIESLIAIEAPTGTNVVSYMDDGKRFYYEAHDPLVLQALQGVHPNPWSKMMTVLRAPKRIFTQSITLDPVFMARNWFRDMFHAFALGRDGAIPVVPGYDSVRGAISSLAKDKKMIEMIAGGGAFDSGFVNANDPAGMAKIIRGRLSAHGFVTNMVTGKMKSAFEFYRELSSSMENSHRVMVFEKSQKAGKSLKAAAYEARDLMDFSMRGAHPMIRFIAETTPFWNARLQGLYRTFRVAGPGQAGKAAGMAIAGMLARGSLLTLASVALFFKNREDERWKELNDFEKNMYYHFFDVFEPGDHYALPKPFEIGAMFSTVPEIIAEGMLSTEPDGGKAAARQFFHVVTEALSLAPDVQAVMPLAELAMNRDTFRDSPILTDYDKQLMPEDQDHYRMSPAIRSVARSMPKAAPDALRSPKQLSHIVHGYTGTLGAYAVGVADMIWWRLNEEEAGLPPEKRPDEIVGVRSFVRNQPRKYPRSLSTLYDVLEDADKIYNSMRRAEKEELFDREEQLEHDNIELILAREVMDDARKEIRDLNKEIREVHLDKDMSPADKRKLIDELLELRNEAARSVYDWRPGGPENVKEVESYRKSIEGADFTGQTRKEQIDTLNGLGLPWTADMMREVSLSPREARGLAG